MWKCECRREGRLEVCVQEEWKVGSVSAGEWKVGGLSGSGVNAGWSGGLEV